jgi:hypothetical protein
MIVDELNMVELDSCRMRQCYPNVIRTCIGFFGPEHHGGVVSALPDAVRNREERSFQIS